MKLKKILASLTAAAMAVTTMAFVPLSVSAADIAEDYTMPVSELETYGTLTFTYSPLKADSCSHSSSDHGGTNPTYCTWCGIYIVGIVKDGNDNIVDNYWFDIGYKAETNADEATASKTLTSEEIIQAFKKSNKWKSDYVLESIKFKAGDCTFGSIVTTPADTTVYDWQSVDVPEPEPNSTNYKFPGHFNTSNINGDNAGIEIVYTCDGSTWEGFNLVNNADGKWTKISNDYGTGQSGTFTQFIKFSELNGELPSENGLFFVSAYNGATLSSVRIKNDSTKGKVYSDIIPVTSVTVTPSTAALEIGDTTALTAEVLPADATDPSITWASSDEKVAAVDKNGKVTAVAEGKATITATSNADDTVFGSCAVTVVSPEAEKYAVNVIKPENGTVTVKGGKTEAYADETIELVITPDADYALDTVTVNGKNISGTSFTMPAEDVTVEVIFKKLGSADAEVVAPEGVSVAFAGSKEDILKAAFGDDYAALVEAGYKLDVVMTVKDESAVSADDKALIEGALSDDMHIGLLVDVSLVKTQDGVSTAVANSSKPVSFVIGVPDSIIADGRTYSVIRVHDGKAEDIGGTFDAANKTITVSSDKFSAYAVVYKDAPAPKPEPQPTVTYYSITADRNVTASASSAAAGTQINVRVAFGYDAYVLCGGKTITKITESGSFTMPAGKVTIVTEANGYLVMVKNAAPNSYIFVYDADMNYIRTNGSVKGIKGEGKITVKLGEEYAGKTVTLYKGRKSTSTELDSKTLDDNGNATFTVEGGKNYTAVVE